MFFGECKNRSRYNRRLVSQPYIITKYKYDDYKLY